MNALGHGERGRIELGIPRTDDSQSILDEQSFDDGLDFDAGTTLGERRAIWRGAIGEGRRLSYAFRVHLPKPQARITKAASARIETGIPKRPELIPDAIEETLQRLRLNEQKEPEAIIASAFGFVAHDIETVAGASDDARLTLRLREGSEKGKSRLLVALLRAAGVEARMATGIALQRSGRVDLTRYVEAQASRGWVRLLTSAETPSEFPANFVRIAAGDSPILSTSGVEASQIEIRVLRESLQPSEIASFVAPASVFWRSLSLYRLPVETQSTLQVLLLLPIAVLIAAIFRNLIGVRTFGTFMPILIALSLRKTDLASGLLLVTSVTCAGVMGRLLLDRLRLLFVPRICLLLCLVILVVTGLAQIGYAFEGRGFMSGLLFPIVILSMLIERISVTTLEEGLESTQKLFLGSLALAASAYPIFQSDTLVHLFFGFPELILCVMACLVLTGGYRGVPNFGALAVPVARVESRRWRESERAVSILSALRAQGVLGINRRNIWYTQAENPRRLYPLVDDKLQTKRLCESAVIPIAPVLASATYHAEVKGLVETLHGRGDFVLKPATGAMGNGIFVIKEATETGWQLAGGRHITHDDLAYHAESIISGLYALGGKPDVAFVEERLRIHPDFDPIALDGVPDVRFVVYRGVPVMAMTRLPTSGSGGRANLHQGAVGAGVDLRSGLTNFAVIKSKPIQEHPDTGHRVVDYPIPLFQEAMRVGIRAIDETGLGYVGADVVIDARYGAVILELNARPGLAIQLANRAGLRPRLEAIRKEATSGMDLEARIELGCRVAEAV